ncbi:MAG: SDR family NAD(P)-dependent oxidoreductase [Alphaproteobacteria bacterium]|nr:SDR family NAD(P)-dependent oxidoreductase [Alphaproteobacteria bacterium]
MNNKRTWIILGGTCVIGRAFAREAAKAGCDVILLGREGEDLTLSADDIRARYPDVEVTTIPLDTANLDSLTKTAAQCEETAKNIISIFSALETAYTQKECGKDLGKIKNMFQINYFSQVYFLSAMAPVLQKQACGEIIVLGSAAGEYGMPDNYAFGSTKAALHVWLQGFQAQMAQNHVSVTTVKADDWDTVGTRHYSFWQKPINPQACAQACLEYAQKGVRIRYFPWYTSLTVLLRRYVPSLNRTLPD